ncbi:polysaccharide deacetylase family protein [Micromonospora costi]|uniref:Polysaccharide deacetylase family protein n=1 Tax=Micromonospora costi TaxID=1530042 RepID=A0A3B0A7A6_9ACTN|nr:polysaccharide deacetylase family protein [Micromonospora costi]RKN57148.1 polysaccharide deacetylase family protein [Micromonospora costi]
MQATTAASRAVRAAGRWSTSPVGTVRRVDTAQPEIVLTYDDGPDPVGTPAVLRALADFGATATFFVLVKRVRRHPSLLDEILAAGHEVALHGFDHTRLTRLGPEEAGRRTRDARAELEQRTGRPVTWFRAPYGALLPRHWVEIRRAGLTPVAWGPTVGDWRELPEPVLAEDGLRQAGPGEIVLCHDGFAGEADGGEPGRAPTFDRGRLAALLLSGLRDRGLAGRALGVVARHGRVRRWAWFKR